jgi:rhamnulokinase
MPKTAEVYLAIDLGASSGRVLAGRFDGEALTLEEINRFSNGPVVAQGRMYWNVLGLWDQIGQGLRSASSRFGDQIRSVGVDTWGVDYCLLGPGDAFLGNPYHYRDSRTVGVMERAFELVRRDEVFDETGLQFMELNTLYQLLATKESNPALLNAAESFLMIPDLFHWLLTGEKTNESTNASTTQLFNPTTGDWSRPLLDRFGIPSRMFLDVASPGTRIGPIQAGVTEATGLKDVDVVLPGTHDTASAVMAVPASSDRNEWCYISSGTWSLMGIESAAPIITAQCRDFNFTNEGGVGNTTRVLKNIAGLWLVQECRRVWKQNGRDYNWDALVEMARAAPQLLSLVDPDLSRFVSPQDMAAEICTFCKETNQPVPADEGAIVRAALESLALRYRAVLGWLEELTGTRLETIHIVGGGTQNRLLCQMTADACNRRVVAGPIEATAVGNLMMQAVAAGEVGTISDARKIIASSFSVDHYEPREPRPWDDAFGRFLEL